MDLSTIPVGHNEALGLFDQSTTIGIGKHQGSCTYDATQQRYTITGAGANIWGTHDDFHYVWRRLRGNFIVTMQATFVGTGVNAHRKLGWMVRSSLDTSSPNVSTGIHGDGLTSLQFRRTAGGPTEEIKAPITHVDVIQLERKGNTYRMSVARFGDPFTAVQVEELDLDDEVYVGLSVCSHDDDVVEQAIFHNVRMVEPVQAGFVRGRDPFGSNLELLDIASGERQIIYQAPGIFEAPNWTLDGQALIYNSGGLLYRFDLAQRQPTVINTGAVTENNNDHVISFDGTMLAISSRAADVKSSVIYTVPITGGEPQRITAQGPSYLHGWSPDGKHLVYTALRNGDYDIYRIAADGADGEQETQLTTAPGLDDGPEYTPAGQYIYFNSVRSGLMQIWRMKADGSEQEQITNDEYNNWFPHISPDGRWIVFLSYLVNEVAPNDHPPAKRVYLRLLPAAALSAQPKVIAYLYGGQGTMNVPSWAPDSKRIAFVSNSVTVLRVA
jgi:TolB protein